MSVLAFSRTRQARLLLLVATIFLCSPAIHVAAGKRQAIPDAKARQDALQIVREVYRKQFETARNNAEKSALARELISQGINSSGDAAACFVLLKVAKDIAQQAEDVQVTFSAIDEIAGRFETDGLELKCDALTGIASLMRLPDDHKKLVAGFDSVLDTVMGENRYDLAEKLMRGAISSARRAKDRTRANNLSAMSREIESMQREQKAAQDALAELEKDPTDAAANKIAGEFRCLVQGDWQGGLPMLALCDDADLHKPAQRELENPTDGLAQMELGEAWFNLASNYQGNRRDQVLAHASQWFRHAEGNVSGLLKIKVAKRLQEIGDLKVITPDKAGNASTKDVEKPLLVHLPLNKDLRDVSGKNMHGTAVGDLKLRPPGYVMFDGRADFIRLPHIPLNNKAFAISFWVRTDTPEERNGFLLQRGTGTLNNMLHLETRNNRCPRMGFYGNDVESTTALRPPGQWNHLVFQYGSGKQQIWQDGKQVASRNATAYAGHFGDTMIGQSPFSRNLSGGMLDFRVYGAELTADEIKALYVLLAAKLQPNGDR